MVGVLQKVKRFEHHTGRKFTLFPKITRSPLNKLDVSALHKWLTYKKKRLADDAFATSEVEGEDDIDNEDDNDDDDYMTESDAED